MKISVLGSGTWGTALARMLSKNGHDVTLWSALPAEIERLSETHTHPNLPGMILPEEIRLTAGLETAVRGSELLLFAVPSVFIRATAARAAVFASPEQYVVCVAKGLEKDSFLVMTDVILEEFAPHVTLRHPPVALSGPTHAEEVAADLPTTIVAASEDPETARLVQLTFSNDVMRVYTNSDVRGVELCGALKNIIALAAGVCDGAGGGDNAKAAIITRGAAEIARLGRAMGCDERTFYGLAGIGDLIVTATSRHSRNNRAGRLIGTGLSAAEAVKEVGMVVEGLNALPAAVGLARRLNVEMPITFAVQELVDGKASPSEMMLRLMRREYKEE